MNLFNFIQDFPDEASCRAHFKDLRDREGVVCKKCECTEQYWLKSREYYQCKKCRFRTSLRSGTVMENSKLPFQYWFMAIHLVTSTKKCFSALELQKQIGHKRYQPIWEMLHKLRIVMGKRDDLHQLEGCVELDEGFFVTVPNEGRVSVLKRGRGSQRLTKVLVMAESEEVHEDNKHSKSHKCGYFKMKVVENLKAETLEAEVKANIKSSSHVKTDAYSSYSKLQKLVRVHERFEVPAAEASKLLPWVHIAISNAKRTLLGIFHMIKVEYLQNYLNEFCYKLNRRYFRENLFNRLMLASLVKWN